LAELKKIYWQASVFLISLSFFAAIAGFTGIKFFLVIFFIFFFPFYLILSRFDLPSDERIIFAAVLSLGIYSIFAYYLAIIFSSLTVSIILSSLILYSLSFFIAFYRKKKA